MEDKSIKFSELNATALLVNNLYWIPFLVAGFLVARMLPSDTVNGGLSLFSGIILTILLSAFAIIWTLLIKVGENYPVNLFSFILIMLFNISFFLYYGIVALVIALVAYTMRYFLIYSRIDNARVLREMHKNSKKAKKENKARKR